MSSYDWSSDSVLVEMNYTNWNTGEPNYFEPKNVTESNGWPIAWKESCIHVIPITGYRWNDLACAIPQCFVCELDMAV